MSLILKFSGVCSEGHFTVFQKIKWCRAKNIGSVAWTILSISALKLSRKTRLTTVSDTFSEWKCRTVRFLEKASGLFNRLRVYWGCGNFPRLSIGLAENNEVNIIQSSKKITALYCWLSQEDVRQGDSDSIVDLKIILENTQKKTALKTHRCLRMTVTAEWILKDPPFAVCSIWLRTEKLESS